MTKPRNLWLLALTEDDQCPGSRWEAGSYLQCQTEQELAEPELHSSTRREWQEMAVAGNGGHSLVAWPAVKGCLLLVRVIDLRHGESTEPGPALSLLTLLLFHVMQGRPGAYKVWLCCSGCKGSDLGLQILLVKEALTFKQRPKLILKTDPVIVIVFMTSLEMK